MLTPSCICNMSMDMVIWYDKCVRYHKNCSSSITCRKWDIRNCFIFRTVLPTIHTENTDQLHSGHWLIEADGHCGQMSVEYDQVRLAARGFKLHVMLLLGTIHT